MREDFRQDPFIESRRLAIVWISMVKTSKAEVANVIVFLQGIEERLQLRLQDLRVVAMKGTVDINVDWWWHRRILSMKDINYLTWIS